MKKAVHELKPVLLDFWASCLLQKYPDSQFARVAEEALSLLR